MDYEKAYKESIERAKNYISGHHTDVDPRSAMECVFPELRESEDENIRQDIIDWLINYKDNVQVDLDDEEVDKWVSWFEKQGEQNPYWSEEDEKHFQGCLNLMRLSLDTKPYPYYNDYLWLKSIKDRVQHQPNQEWNEYDEKISKAIYESIDFLCLKHFGVSEDEVCDWLTSPRPRHITYELDAPLGHDKDMNPIYPPINHWRPSPEQMRAVFDASERNDKLGSVLHNLYEDLRKL